MNQTDYKLLDSQLHALLDDDVGLLYNAIDDINWLGIYVLRGDELVLGPFQGKPACVHIGLDEGVCGAAASTLQTQRVADVHAFPGHITCDADSRSELVIPLIVNGELIGVLDIDSPEPARFSETDQAGVERLCRTFCALQEQRKNFI
jgi:GAF domain-containing protein